MPSFCLKYCIGLFTRAKQIANYKLAPLQRIQIKNSELKRGMSETQMIRIVLLRWVKDGFFVEGGAGRRKNVVVRRGWWMCADESSGLAIKAIVVVVCSRRGAKICSETSKSSQAAQHVCSKGRTVVPLWLWDWQWWCWPCKCSVRQWSASLPWSISSATSPCLSEQMTARP